MNKILKMALVRKQEGATAVEYGLIAGLIAVAIAAVVFALGGDLEATFQTVTDCLGGTCP